MACYFVLPLPRVLADDAKTREAIEAVLRKLETAAVAGDKAGWLAHIPADDSEWLHEQTYFANDLTKKPVEKLSITLKDVTPVEGGATAEVTFAWNLPGARSRSVDFGAKFVERDGRWLYAGETWERHEAPGVVVLHDPGLGELASRVVEAFSAIRGPVQEGFEMQQGELASRTQQIKLYGSMKHLQQSICLSYKDGLAGWNEPGESIKLLANGRSQVPELKVLLAHEFGHVATFATGPKANDMMPWWLLEGVAELSAEAVAGSPSPNGMVDAWARQGNLAPWDDLADFDTIQQKWYGHVYKQGHHLMKFISDRWKREGRNAWLRAMGQGKTLDEATKEVFKISFEELDRQWRATLPGAAKPDAPSPAASDGT